MDLDSAIKELHSLSSSSPKKTVRFAPDVERYFTLTPTHWKDGVRESDLKPQDVADCQSHSFKTKVFKETQNCRVCRDVIWNEGRCCKACKLPCHKKCEYKVLTACVSPERYPMLRNEEIKQTALNQRNAEERKYKMMSPGVEVKTTIKSSDGPVRYAFDLDVDYITERIIAMSFPSGGPEAQYRSNLKDVVNMLKTKHQNKYIIFNLSKRRNDIIKMNEQVLDVGWHDSLAPPLERLCSICKQIEIWLKKDSQNVIVLHCKGSRSPIGVVVLAYMNYINITANTETALDRYAMRRFMEAKTDKHVQPSQFRYEEYFTGLLTGAISINSAPLYLHHVLIHGVPNYDANGGCRPFLRIYQGMQTVFTSGVYTVPEGTTKFVISLDKALPLRGDILVKCYHKKFRSSTRDVIFRCQFHTTAVVEYRLLFGKQDLDDACTDARFPPFTKVEFIFSSTGDSLHNSDYVSNSNFPVDNGDDPLIRWDSYENFSKLVEGQDSEPDSPQPNGGNNNNLSPGPQKYIYASDGSPYAQVQKTPSFSKPQEPLIIPQSQTPVVHQQPPSNPQTNGPTRPYPYSNQNGHTGSPRPAVSPSGPPVPGNPVERTPSGRKMDFKEQRELEELLRGIEDDKGFQDLKSNSNQMPGSPQKSPIAESPGNRRIVSVHAELKNAPIPTKKTTPVRPIVEEEFENSPRNFLPSEQSTLTAPNSRHVEPTVTPQQTTSVHSTPPPRDQERTPTKTANESLPSNMQTLPNGNVPRDRVPGIPLEHANPTYDYTDKGRGDPNRTMGEVEEPLTEVRLKASPVQLHSLGESKTESAPLSRTPSNVSSNYEPQPLRAQQQKIRFITQYDETDHGGPAASRVGDQSSVGRPQQPDDGFQWLQKQQFKLKEQKDKDGGQTDRYSNPLLVREPGIHPSHQSNVHQRAPSSQPETISHPHGVPYQSSGLHSPGSSVKSEPVNNVSSRPYVSDNLSWLEQQQMKLREKRNRERLQMDPSYPLQVDTSYNTSQLPSQPSSISSVRSDVSGFSNNTPYSQRHPDSMATRRGHHPEPLVVGNQMQDTYQPSLRKGPPTPAFGYDNMASNQEVISPANGPLDLRPYHQDHQTPVRSPSQNQGGQTVGTRLFIDEPLSSRSKGDIEANANNSANVYRPNKYALDTSLPSKSAVGGSRPVNRSNSLGGYESDSAIQYRPSKGEAESWIQNPGALPSQESEYWNRIEGLRSPGEKSPRDMHSSNESLPNGGTTPKFPVGPKGYANMVRTCIAVVGKPPHGPDDPLPLSPKREDPAADEFDVSFPRYPEPARKLASDTRPTPAQEPPLQIRHLEPAQFQFTEVPAEERPSHSVERIPHQDPLPAESRMRTPVSDARVPSREGPIDVKSLEMLLESVSPIEARGGVPDRPTSPWSHPDVGGKGVGVVGPQNPSSQQKRQEPEIHYAQVDIEQTTPTQLDRPHEEPVKYAHIQVKPNSYQQTTPTSSSELSQTPSIGRQNHLPAGYQPSYKVPVTSTMQHPVVVEEPISKTHLSPAKVVIEDIPSDRPDQTYHPSPASGQTAAPPPGMPIDAKVVIENRQQVVNSSPSHVKSPSKVRPMSPVGNPGRQPTHPGYSAVHPSSSGSPNIQQTSPHYMQPQRAVIEQSSPQPQHEQYSSPQHRQAMLQEHIPPQQYSSPLHVSPLQVRPPQQNLPPQQRILYSQEIRKEPIHQTPQYYPQEEQQYQPSSYPPQHQVGSPSQHPVYQQQPTYKQHQQQHRPLQQHQPSEPPQQQTLNQQQNQQQPTQYHQHPQLQRLQQQQSPGSDLPSISFSEATPPPKHVDQQESPIFQQTVGGEESSRSPDPQGLEPTSAPPPMYPTYSDRMKNRPQPLYPTFSDRHRRGHPRLEETFPNVANGNYKTLYDNRAGSKGRGSSGSDGSAVSPGTTSPVRQAVSPAGPSPIQSGRSTPSNFYLMPFASPYGSNSSLADPNKEHVRFVKDLSSWWYKPHISREEAIGLLRDKQPGTFVVRDSNSFPGAFGLAIKVAQAPANAPPKKGGDPGNELIRHFLIEPNNRGVRLKGCTNEPIFGSLSALIYQHTLTQLALPCKLVLPDVDPSGGVDSPDAIDPKSAAALLQQGAACSVLYLQCVDMESLTGPSAVREAITRVMNQKEKPKGVKVHFKVSLKGVTLTDSARKLFFRKHFPVESILYCGMDPGSRKFPRMAGQDDPDAKCFGFVSRKPGSLTDNQCMVFAEYEMEQPASAIVSFVTKVLLGSKQIKTP